ncbi:MAG: hypothetical protein KAT65_26610 [Methanophagales archaeon]|nr:hypothetical protein [Methanophagales archaeon]
MVGWIAAFIILFCLVVFIILYYFESRDNRELRERLKETSEYKSGKRSEYLERYIAQFLKKKKQDTVFTATFENVGMDSIEDTLHTMIKRARREILLVSPWITEGIWGRMRVTIIEFMDNGGVVKVFIRGVEDDFASGLSDRGVVDEITRHGGKVTFVPRLHAKLCVVDRCETLISSANLTRSGLDFGYEAGVWSCNPGILREVCRFVDKLGG